MAWKTIGPKQFQTAFKAQSNTFILDVQKIAVKAITGAIYARLVEINPVLTGLSRNNWWIEFNKESGKKTATVSSVKQTGLPITGTEMARVKKAFARLDNLKVLPKTVWITNNIHYIVYINAGTSKKAPDGIAEVAILSALSGRATNLMSKLPKPRT